MSDSGTIEPDVSIASSLASTVRLLDISCVGLSAKIVSTIEPTVLSYDLEEVRIDWRLSGRDIVAVLPYGLIAHAGDVKVATFSVALRADYQIITTENQPQVQHLVHYIGVMSYMHTWPYFRADMQYLTTKLGFPALVLPVVLSGHVPRRVRVAAAPVQVERAQSAEVAVRPKKALSGRKKTPKRRGVS